ncbi:MAG: pilin [Candidatus Jorgensenbacteria bacterium]
MSKPTFTSLTLLFIIGITIVPFIVGGLYVPTASAAVDSAGIKVTLPNPLGTTSTAQSLLERIVDWLMLAAAPVAGVMIIYGAFQMLFAGGDTEKFTNGKKTILYAVVGYGIILIGWGLVSIIEGVLTTEPPPR